jgi:hypothetical protein
VLDGGRRVAGWKKRISVVAAWKLTQVCIASPPFALFIN